MASESSSRTHFDDDDATSPDEGDPTIPDLPDLRLVMRSFDRSLRAHAPLRTIDVGFVRTGRGLHPGVLGRALGAAIGRDARVRRFDTCGELVEAIADAEVQLAWLPPVAYVRARLACGARMLCAMERGGPAQYGSALVCREGSIRSLNDLRGRRAGWVDPWSATGYLAPRAMLRAYGLSPDLALSSQAFMGSHEAVLRAVGSGMIDVGATYCTLDEKGRIVRGPFDHIPGIDVWMTSGPIPGDVLCVPPSPTEDEDALRARLFERRADGLLGLLGASRLVAGDVARYDELERALVPEAR